MRSGQNVTLHCQGPSGVNITLLEWSIPEIKSDGYVFFYRNRRSYESYQHERFKGRVELADPSMENGDVSVILKNVSVNDTGTYECRIITSDLSSGQRVQSETRQSINLTVTDSGELRGSLYYLFFFWLVGTCGGKLQPLTARLSTKELFVSLNCDAGFSEGSIICSFMVNTEDHACYFPPSDKRKRRKIPNLRQWKGFKNILVVFGWALNLAQTLMFMKSSLQTAVILFFCFYCGLRYNDTSCSDRWWHIWSDAVVYWLCFIFIQTSAIALFSHALCDIIIPPECVVHVWSPRTNLDCLIVQSFECGGAVN